jgi:hypothetical protein
LNNQRFAACQKIQLIFPIETRLVWSLFEFAAFLFQTSYLAGVRAAIPLPCRKEYRSTSSKKLGVDPMSEYIEAHVNRDGFPPIKWILKRHLEKIGDIKREPAAVRQYPQVKYCFYYRSNWNHWESTTDFYTVYYDENMNLVGLFCNWNNGDMWRFIPTQELNEEDMEEIRQLEQYVDKTIAQSAP